MESRLLVISVFCAVLLRPILADDPASSVAPEIRQDGVDDETVATTEIIAETLTEDVEEVVSSTVEEESLPDEQNDDVETSTTFPEMPTEEPQTTTTEESLQTTTEEEQTTSTTTEQDTSTTTEQEQTTSTTTEQTTTAEQETTSQKPTTPKPHNRKGPIIIFFFLPKRHITRTNIQYYLRKLKDRTLGTAGPVASGSQIYETIVPAPPSLGPDLANSESGYFPAYYPYPYRAEDYYHQMGSTRSRLDQDYFPQHPNVLGSGNFEVVRGGVFSEQASAEQSRRDFTHHEYDDDDDDDYDDNEDEDDDKFADFDSFPSRIVTQVEDDDSQFRRPSGGSASQLIPITTVLEAVA